MNINQDVLSRLIIDLVTHHCKPADMAISEFHEMLLQHDHHGKWLLDSLSSYQAGAYVAQFFHLADWMNPEDLLQTPNLENWSRFASQALNKKNAKITFMTSGSSGKPKAIEHALATLIEEAKYWAKHYQHVQSVVSVIPSHHIYGFIWTVLLPSVLGKPVVNKSGVFPNQLFSSSYSILLVSLPNLLPTYLRFAPFASPNVDVVVSAGPCDHELLTSMKSAGCRSVLHVYGSTETGGVGYRNEQSEHYETLGYLRCENGKLVRNSHPLPIQDELKMLPNNRFDVLKRMDRKVVVNGKNISLTSLSADIESVNGIQHCHIKTVEQNMMASLHLFVVVEKGQMIHEASLRQAIFNRCPSVPFARIQFGEVLPLDNMGKVRLDNISAH